ncbi:MAG: hypothetical protein DLM56_14755 [Pseudonocardiales bacterium]|nr:MAG: hypothetical protein DLM56_14755 [Pseudonocardiales bacterium]
MVTRLALTEDQFDPLAASLDAGDETAAVLAATLTGDPATFHAGATGASAGRASQWPAGAGQASAGRVTVTLSTRTLTWVPEEAYFQRTALGLSIASTGWVPAFRADVSGGGVPVFVHTHPGGHAAFSAYDDDVDAALAAAARSFGAAAYASVVVAGRSTAPAAVARLCVFGTGAVADVGASAGAPASTFVTVDAIRVAGSAMRLLLPPEPDAPAVDADSVGCEALDSASDVDVFDRQVRMLGTDGQRTLHAVNAAVIGAGGTGSAVAVQLARIGVGGLCLVDDDVVTGPTPTRGHGMRVADVGRPKVEVLGQHLRDIGLGTRISEVKAPLHDPQALHAIQHADVVFSCVDGHGARLSSIATPTHTWPSS